MAKKQVKPPSPEEMRLLAARPRDLAQALTEGMAQTTAEEQDLQRQTQLSMAETVRFYQALQELTRRQNEALNLYEPLPVQERFHASMASERILRGGNRSGKTAAAAIECARAATGQDPFGKYPRANTVIFIVGYDLNHIGRVIYPYLFKPGAFAIIRDLETDRWRAFRPWDPRDRERDAEKKLAPPLIPPRYIVKFAYETKSKNIFSKVILSNGTEIYAFSSKGEPPQGTSCDLYWIDEDIEREDFVLEAQARLSDRRGRFIWSALPQSRNLALATMSERAAEDSTATVRDIEEFVLRFSDNPHIHADEKRKRLKSWSEEERLVRDAGEFAISNWKVYPEFDWQLHGLELPGGVPAHWTRYAITDPGRQVCAVLFAACPPPPADYVLLYRELYLERCTADLYGQSMARATTGEDIEAFVIDISGARATEIGSGVTIEQQYSDALRRHKVQSRKTGHRFLHSIPKVQEGIEAVRDYLRIRADGTPRLRVLCGKNEKEFMPHFDREIKYFHYRRVREEGGTYRVTDEPDERRHSHLMACLRYLCLFRPRWVKPPVAARVDDSVWRIFEREQARKRKANGPSFVNLGPSERPGFKS